MAIGQCSKDANGKRMLDFGGPGSQLILVIDPGHPSYSGDVGCAHDGFIEKDWTLHMSLMLRERLLETSWPVGIALTRWRDEVVSFHDRVAVMEQANPHLVLSLHVDAIGDPRTCGLQAYRLLGDYGTAGVASAIAKGYPRQGWYVNAKNEVRKRRISTPFAQPNRAHWTWNAFCVLTRYSDFHPVLVECGFASNPDEHRWMRSPLGQETIVEHLKKGVEQALVESRRL
jgi:N-acetylmuramoyl-L-alanine amidase